MGYGRESPGHTCLKLVLLPFLYNSFFGKMKKGVSKNKPQKRRIREREKRERVCV